MRTFLVLPGGPPSHDTFNRLFQMLDPAAFADTFARWTESLRAALPAGEREIVALDGKAARRALNAGEDTRYLVSAWAIEQGLTLGQMQVADKGNEITAVPALLRFGVDGLRGHCRCLALPEEHGQRDQRGGRRLRARPRRQSGHGLPGDQGRVG